MEEVKASSGTFDTESLSPCGQEEADSRIFLHVKHAVLQGHEQVLIRTVDCDVVAIALYVVHYIAVHYKAQWIALGVGEYRRLLPIHEYATQLGPE